MKTTFSTVLAVLLAPGAAWAHEGAVPHVHGDDPHLLGAAFVFATVGAAVFGLRRLAARRSKGGPR